MFVWLVTTCWCFPGFLGTILALSAQSGYFTVSELPYTSYERMISLWLQISDNFSRNVVSYSWIGPRVLTYKHTKTNSRTNQKCYDNSKATVEKLLVRRIQIFRVRFCIIHLWPLFKIAFNIMSEAKFTRKNRIRLVEYSCSEVSCPSEMSRFVWKFGN